MASISSECPKDCKTGEFAREDIVVVRMPEGALSIELEPIGEGLARGFLRFSPRNPKLSADAAARLSAELCRRPYERILIQDSKKGLLRRLLSRVGWNTVPAVSRSVPARCSMVTIYDVPLDEGLIDSEGSKPELTNTHSWQGICVDVGGRNAWAFYSDEGESARVIFEEERRTGMLIGYSAEDLTLVADALVRFLASAGKSWAVFSMNMGRFVRRFNPITMRRMALDNPRAYDHNVERVSRSNKALIVRLFSEYYDESMIQARLRLRRFRSDPNYQMFVVDGGFVITRVEGNAGLIYDIYVTPAMQGRGLGAELMRCALTSLAGKVSSVYLHTSYPRARRLYERFGFRTVYTQLGIRLDELLMTPPAEARKARTHNPQTPQ